MKPGDVLAAVAALPRPMPFLRTLRARFFALAIAGLALVATVALLKAIKERSGAEEAARLGASTLAQSAAERLDEHFAQMDTVLTLTGTMVERHLDDPQRMDEILKALHRTLPPTFVGLSVLMPDGRIAASATLSPAERSAVDLGRNGFFRTVVDEGRFAVSEPYVGPVAPQRIVTAGRPIGGTDKAVRAAIAASTGLDQIEQIAVPLVAPGGARVGIYLPDDTLVAGQSAAEWSEPMLTAAAESARTGWVVRVAIPRSIALAGADQKLYNDVLLILSICAGMALFTLWLGARIARPIEHLRVGAARLAAGDLGHRVEASRDTEFAQLVRDFNAMAAELEYQRQALIEGESRWQFALEGAGAAVWDWNVTTGREFHSPRASQMIGDHVADYAAWERRIHSDDVDAVRAGMRLVLKEPGKTAVIEYRIRHADGAWRWIEGRATTVARDETGRAVRVVGTNADITDRKHAQERVARLGRMLAALNALNETIARVESPTEVYRRFCDLAVAHSDLRLALVRLVDDVRGMLVVSAQAGPQKSHHVDESIPAELEGTLTRRAAFIALREGRTTVTNDVREVADTPWGAAAIAHGLFATVSCPVRRGGRVTGLFSLFAAEPGYFDAELVGLIERMGTSLSFALDNFDREAERRGAEKALRASEERFRALTALSSDWYWEQDAEFRFTFVSGDLHGRLGLDADTHIGKTRWDVPALNLTEADWDRHRALLERHEPFYEFEIRRPDIDGRPRWASISGHPVFDAVGRFQGYRGVGRDITDRKLSELAVGQLLAEKAALVDRLRLQFESMPIGCLLADAQHRVTYANPAAERIFGVAARDLEGGQVAPRFFDPGLQQLVALRRQRLEANEEIEPIVLSVHRPDGTERRCEVHSTALRDHDGFAGVIRMLIDVTDRERAQAALRESEQRYRSLIEVAPDGIVLVRDGYIDYANDAMAHIMHTANADDLVGRSFGQLFVEQERAAIAEQLARLDHETGPGARTDRQIVAVDGRIVDVDMRCASYRWHDAVYMQATIRDNTVRKAIHRRVLEINVELERRVNDRTAELQAANRELEAFSYSVAHDLRAPLRAIDGFTRILAEDLRGRMDASMQRSFERVRANVARMAQLIDDLLAFARVGRRELEMVDVDTAELCRAVCDELTPSYPQAVVQIGALPVVRGDTTLLRQVFANLLANALKFSAQAETPRIEIGCAEASGDHIFYVRDNGVGFSMDYAHKLFGVFQRLHGSQEFEGTGVGLAIVLRSVQRHNGRAWAEGEPGRGATFYFALPI